MSLLALIRKGGLAKAATATTATLATQGGKKAGTVAIVATVAVANPPSPKTVTAWGWLLHFTDRDPVEVYFSPVATHAEALAAYPGALVAEPIPTTPTRKPTDAESAELSRLVDAVADFHGFTLEQRTEAQQIAQADPVAAMECFRSLAAKIDRS